MAKTDTVILLVMGTVCLLTGVIGVRPPVAGRNGQALINQASADDKPQVNRVGPDFLSTRGLASDYQAEAQLEKVFGIFEVGSSDSDKTFCRYKVTGLSGSKCPLAFGGVVCIPCQSEQDCKKIGSSITVDIADDQGIELLCRVLLERLSDTCEECPREGMKIIEAEQVVPDTFVLDEREPQRNEKFCRFTTEKVIAEDKKKECPLKKGQVFCIHCFDRKKCYLEGLEVVFLDIRQNESSPKCLVVARSLSLSCKECEKKGKIIK